MTTDPHDDARSDTRDDARDDADAAAEVLACGRALDDLLDQVFTGRSGDLDSHQRSCGHCRTVLAETDRQWAPLRAAGARLETPPPGLRRSVMAAVRRLAGQRWAVTLAGAGAAGAGVTRVSSAVVAEVAERAAARVPGVRRAWVRVVDEAQDGTRTGAAHAAAGVAAGVAAGAVGRVGTHVVVQLLLAVEYGARLPRVARTARSAVRRELAAVTSLLDTRVDVHIDDVATP